MGRYSKQTCRLIVFALAFIMLAPVGLTFTSSDVILAGFPPTVTVNTPRSEEQIYNGIIMIDWLATDVEDNDATLDITIECSDDAATTWSTIITGTNNNNPPYAWDTIAAGIIDSVNYLFKITATDNAHQSTSDTSYMFSIDNTPNDRWYLQVESMNLGTNLDLDMKPSESTAQEISVEVPEFGDILVQSFASDYVAHCEVDIAGDWEFSIYARVSSSSANGSLYANVYADDGIASRLLFTTGCDDESLRGHYEYHEFSWVHSVPTDIMIHAGEHVVVEIMLNASTDANPSTYNHYANTDIPIVGNVSGDYTMTLDSDDQDEIINEVGGNGTSVVYLDEDFSEGIPMNTWTIIDRGHGGPPGETPHSGTWTDTNPGNRIPAPPIIDPFAIVDSLVHHGEMDEQLITPDLDLSSTISVAIEFDQFFLVAYGPNTRANVDVRSSLTNGSWQNVLNQTQTTPDPDHKNINITTWAAGAPDVEIRFYYYAAFINGWWIVDNVIVHALTNVSLLKHKWTIDVPAYEEPYEFSLEARRPNSPDGDNFIFAYSCDDVTYIDMFTVDQKVEALHTYLLPATTFGTIYIRVVDTERSSGQDISSIKIDQMFISSYTWGSVPVSHTNYPRADIPVLGNVDGDYSFTVVSDNQYETIEEVGGGASTTEVILDDDFTTSYPSFPPGWRVIDGGNGHGQASTWTLRNPGNRIPVSPIADPFAIVDAQCFFGGQSGYEMIEELITPVLDLSFATSVTLEFDQFYFDWGPLNDAAHVDVRSSLTNGYWENVYFNCNRTTPNPEHQTINITAQAAGAQDVEIRFFYSDKFWGYYWMVDNVLIKASMLNISLLEHKWAIDVPAGEGPYEFNLEAKRPVNPDNDDFVFAYSTDNVNFTDMVTVNSHNENIYTYSLPANLSGTVYIRVVDTDRTSGNRDTSIIEIDRMFISSVGGPKLILGLDHYSTPSSVVPWLTLVPPVYLCIQDAPGGMGNNVTTHTMTTDDTFTVWSIGLDAYWNYISEVPANWTNTLNAQTAITSTSFTLDPTAPGSGTITAVFNATLSDTTGLITVTLGLPDKIVIRDSPGGLGNEVGAHSMTTDETLTVWAAGYDADGNYIGDINCNWSTNETLDLQSANDVNQFTFDPLTADTSGYIIAINGTVAGSAGLINVGVGVLDNVIIRYAPGGTGPEVADVSMALGQTLTVYSAGYDGDGNYIGDISCNWATTGTLNHTTATNISSFIFEPAIGGETGTINATFNTTIFDETGTITVTEYGTDYIVIEDDSGNEVTTHNMTTEVTFTVWAISYNNTFGLMGPVNVNWTTTGTLDFQTAFYSQSFTFDPVHALTNGTIEAEYGTLWDATGMISVNPGPLTYLCVEDAPGGTGANVTTHTMTTEETLKVWAIGYDAEWNYIGGINCDWTTTGTLDLQTATGVNTFTFSPVTPGMGTIEADDLAGHTDSTGLITVNIGALSYLLIRDSPGGLGNKVGNHTMTTDDALTIWAAGYDVDWNYIGDINCNWSTNGTLDFQSANGVNQFTFYPSTAGTSGYIKAKNGVLLGSTGLITVGTGALKYITIRDTPGGGGSEVGDVLMGINQILLVYSAGYDGDNNYIGNTPCNWTTTGTLNLTTATSSSSFTFKPAAAGETGTIVATFNPTISDETGIITVVADLPPVANAGPDKIVIVNSFVGFDGTGSHDDIGITNYWWNFTDGGPITLTGVYPIPYFFDTVGVYIVTLTVRDTAGQEDQDTMIVNVTTDPTPPVANAGPDQNVRKNQVVTFNGTASYDPGHIGEPIHDGIVNWTWTFNDGGLVTLWGMNPQYTFTNVGTHIVDLIVRDAVGLTDTDQMNVTVIEVFDIDIMPAAGSDGWILISFPSKIEGNPLSIITDAVDGGAGLVTWDIVQWYDPTSPQGTEWKTTATFKPPSLNTFNYVNNTYSFWIHISNYGDGTLSIEGALPSTGEWATISLYAGWNLVGYPSLAQKCVSDALTGTGYDAVEVFDPTDPYRTKEVGPTYVMKPGEGYWVHVPADTIWIINW